MCGVPFHAYENYMARLIRQGFRVAICEQVEEAAEAKKRGKGPVRRAVTRVVTPGTLTEDTLLDARASNYLAALAETGGEIALASIELSTGHVGIESLAEGEVAAALARLQPTELLIADRSIEKPAWFELLGEWRQQLTVQSGRFFDSETARRRLEETYGVATLDAFGSFTRAELAALGAIAAYIDLTQKDSAPSLRPATAPRDRQRDGNRSRDPPQSGTDTNLVGRTQRHAARCDRLHADGRGWPSFMRPAIGALDRFAHYFPAP